MEIETLEVNKINPAIYNPRKDLKPGDIEYEKLKKSILEFDMVEPLVWNKRTGNLVGGHQRLKILKELGIEKVEVSVVDLSEVKEKALNLALNKIQGDWDFPALKDLLEELDTGEFDIEITGFDIKEIEDLMSQFHVPGEGLTDDDAIPEATESINRRGDLWSLGNHRLLCGDATIQADVERLMGGEKADMVFTDPPYRLKSKTFGYKGQAKYGDLDSDKVFAFEEWIPIIKVVSASDFNICVFEHWYNIIDLWQEMAKFFTIRNLIIWHATNRFTWAQRCFINRYDICLYGTKGQYTFNGKNLGERIDDILGEPVESEYTTGQTQVLGAKPVKFLTNYMKVLSNLGKIVLDLFGGSGSTLIACEKLNRRCYMMEIDEHYCDVIIQRWQNFTGKEAVKIG